MIVENTSGVRYDELVEIELGNGEKRRGRVLEIESTRALVQVFEGTSGIDIADTKVRFIGKVLTLPVSRDMLGRVFNGRGDPIDGGAPLIAEKKLDINGMPMNPYSCQFRNHVGKRKFQFFNCVNEHGLELSQRSVEDKSHRNIRQL